MHVDGSGDQYWNVRCSVKDHISIILKENLDERVMFHMAALIKDVQ